MGRGGRPDGRSDEYWNRAVREIDGQSGDSHEDQEAKQAMREEPSPVLDIGRASSSQPGGTTPASTSVGTSPPVGGTRKRSKR